MFKLYFKFVKFLKEEIGWSTIAYFLYWIFAIFNNSLAQYNCGVFHFNGYGKKEKDIDKAKKFWEKSAKKNYYEAENNLSACFLEEKNFTKVIEYAKKAIEHNKEKEEESKKISYHNLGLGYYYIDEVELAIENLKKSYSLGNPLSLEYISNLYYKSEKYHESIIWLKKYLNDYDLNDSEKRKIYSNMGVCYKELNFFEEAIYCWEVGANLGSINCQFFLGVICAEVKDIKNAFYWFLLASENENIKKCSFYEEEFKFSAKNNLGVLYYNEANKIDKEDNEKNRLKEKAEFYLKEASEKNEDAKDNLKNLFNTQIIHKEVEKVHTKKQLLKYIKTEDIISSVEKKSIEKHDSMYSPINNNFFIKNFNSFLLAVLGSVFGGLLLLYWKSSFDFLN